MLKGKSAKEWIDAYLDNKSPELAEVADKRRRLVKKTVAGTKESVSPFPRSSPTGRCVFSRLGKIQ